MGYLGFKIEVKYKISAVQIIMSDNIFFHRKLAVVREISPCMYTCMCTLARRELMQAHLRNTIFIRLSTHYIFNEINNRHF